MDGQICLFPDGEIKKKSDTAKKIKRNWENAFQKWSDKRSLDGTDPMGVCGYGIICDYCTDNTYGRPCVRALNERCRKKGIEIEYTNRTEEYFEGVWYGCFERKDDGDKL